MYLQRNLAISQDFLAFLSYQSDEPSYAPYLTQSKRQTGCCVWSEETSGGSFSEEPQVETVTGTPANAPTRFLAGINRDTPLEPLTFRASFRQRRMRTVTTRTDAGAQRKANNVFALSSASGTPYQRGKEAMERMRRYLCKNPFSLSLSREPCFF